MSHKWDIASLHANLRTMNNCVARHRFGGVRGIKCPCNREN